MSNYIFGLKPTHDFSQVQPAGIIPQGVYTSQITEVVRREGQNSSEYFSITYTVLEGDYAGQSVRGNLFINFRDEIELRKVEDRVQRLLRACNVTDMLEDGSGLLGATLQIRVTQRFNIKDQRSYINVDPIMPTPVVKAYKTELNLVQRQPEKPSPICSMSEEAVMAEVIRRAAVNGGTR